MTAEAFLGVERSLLGRRWRARGGEERAGLAIAQRLALPEIVGRLLAGRGIAPEAAESFLSPTLRELLPDPSRFLDMDKAADRLARAVQAGRGDRRLRRLRRRRRHLVGAARPLLRRGRPADPRLYPRPDEGGLWPEPAGAAGPPGRGRAAGHHRRLRHHRLRAAGGRGGRRARGHRGRPPCGRAAAARRPSRWSIPTGSTRPRAMASSPPWASPSCWRWPSTGPCAGPAGMARGGPSPI